jgi:hypothetical protein
MQRSAAREGQSTARKELSLPFVLFAGCAVLALVFAFVRLGGWSYWTDELFTLFVVGHNGGLSEVLRRALTDTHPPAYYFLLYEWSRLAGLSEAPLRISSAVAAVGAALVFWFGLRRVFSPVARAFALAISLNASFWFDQAQNIRSYSLCMLLGAVLAVAALEARRQVREGRGLPPWPAVALVLAGGLGSFSHDYVFLETGLVFVFLTLTVPSWPLRVLLVLAGLAIAGLDAVYARALLQATRQDVHHMWFRSDPVFFFNQITVAWRIVFGISGAVALALLAVVAWRRRGEPRRPGPEGGDRLWLAGLAAFVHFGMFALGAAVSILLAPSMSSMNLATAAPMLWILAAWLYEIGSPRGGRGWSRAFAAVLVLAALAHLTVLSGRFIPRNEDWRGSARYIEGLPACGGKPIPVVLPKNFGPDTPFFRTLARESFYGRYFPRTALLQVASAEELTGAKPMPALAALVAARARGTDACPVLAWGVHDLSPEDAEALREGLARRGAPVRVEIKRFDNYGHEELGYSPAFGAYVFLAAR